MHLKHLKIRNFRGVDDLDLAVKGESLILIGPNGGGKTTLLVAVAKALGRDRSMTNRDFIDPSEPVEITCVLDDLSSEAHSELSGQLSFGTTTTVTVGVRAAFDADDIEIVHGFPGDGWRRATRAQLEVLPVLWLPAWRDPEKLLAIVGTRSLVARLFGELSIEAEMNQAAQEVASAAMSLAAAPPIASLLSDAASQLGALVPGIAPGALSLGQPDDVDLLRLFALHLEAGGPPIEISRQSSGLGQLCIFTAALRAIDQHPGALLLLDEPEVSLHPQAQRAVISAFGATGTQALIATHSPAVLDRVDPRTIVRLARTGNFVTMQRPAVAGDSDARRLMRHADVRIAEAFFARAVLLVEGPSDRLALLAVAAKQARDIDGDGVCILALDGAGLFATIYRLLGSSGLGVNVAGMCDANYETTWGRALAAPGSPPLSRAQLRALDIIVVDPDLEPLLVDALGVTNVEAILQAEGEHQRFEKFVQQPANVGVARRELLLRFLKKDNTRWVPLIVEALDISAVPQPLIEALSVV